MYNIINYKLKKIFNLSYKVYPFDDTVRFKEITISIIFYKNDNYYKKNFKFLSILMSKNDILMSPQCSICLENYKLNEKAILLPCTHYFHLNCLKEWFIRKQKCPYCTIEYNYTSIINIINNRNNRIQSITS